MKSIHIKTKILYIITCGLFTSLLSFSQERLTENTLRLITDTPPASINDVSWLKGNWTSRISNGSLKETWNEPVAGIMKGSYKLTVNEQESSYYILSIYEKSNSLILSMQQVKRDQDGKEFIAEASLYPLVKLTTSKACFEGITFEQFNVNRLIIYTSRKAGDGNYEEQKQVFFRDGADACLI